MDLDLHEPSARHAGCDSPSCLACLRGENPRLGGNVCRQRPSQVFAHGAGLSKKGKTREDEQDFETPSQPSITPRTRSNAKARGRGEGRVANRDKDGRGGKKKGGRANKKKK